MMLGQWGHSYPDEVSPPSEREDFADILLRWFDRWLKGDERSSTGPAVEVQDADDVWRRESKWPPQGRTALLRPSPSGGLAADSRPQQGTVLLAADPFHFQDPLAAQGAGIGTGGADLPVDPAQICAQPLCAAFRTAPMQAVYRIAGIPRLRLTATPLGPGGTVSAFVFAEGGEGLRRIAWGQVDLRFPRGDDVSRSVEPGTPIALDFTLQPFDAPVRKGERLTLVLSMGNTYNRLPATAPGPVILELGDRTTGLRLTAVSPARSQFFRPPR
ncbi:MAG: CocE/NonD family hydrolase C-terminal non-catalytic domain-containing protein, partial [Actinomycetota bacterium]